MNELKLVSKHLGAIRPLDESALEAAARDMELGIQSTEQRLQARRISYTEGQKDDVIWLWDIEFID